MATNNEYQHLLERDEVLQIVRKYTGNDTVNLNSFEIKPLSEGVSGFLGVHLILRVNIDDNKEVTFFTKKMPTDIEAFMKYAQDTRAYYKEIELFRTLFEDLKDAQDRLDHRWRPEFYFARNEEFLVLEDLSLCGYKMYPERELFDGEHTLVALKSLSKMHAASIIFEEKFNRKLLSTRSPFYEPVDRRVEIGEIYPHLIFESESTGIVGHLGNTLIEAGISSETILLDYLEGYTAEEMKTITEKLPGVMREMIMLVKPSTKYKNVIVHGDLWANNLLFKYDETGHVKHAIIIDFQIARYGPPAHDIIMFFHLTQSREFREENLERFLKFYYDQFSNELKTYDIDSAQVYPWEVFRESCDFYHKFGAITSLFYYQMILLPELLAERFLSSAELFEKNMFVDRSELIKESFLTDKSNRKRITESLHEVIDTYIIKK